MLKVASGSGAEGGGADTELPAALTEAPLCSPFQLLRRPPLLLFYILYTSIRRFISILCKKKKNTFPPGAGIALISKSWCCMEGGREERSASPTTSTFPAAAAAAAFVASARIPFCCKRPIDPRYYYSAAAASSFPPPPPPPLLFLPKAEPAPAASQPASEKAKATSERSRHECAIPRHLASRLASARPAASGAGWRPGKEDGPAASEGPGRSGSGGGVGVERLRCALPYCLRSGSGLARAAVGAAQRARGAMVVSEGSGWAGQEGSRLSVRPAVCLSGGREGEGATAEAVGKPGYLRLPRHAPVTIETQKGRPARPNPGRRRSSSAASPLSRVVA